MYEPAPGYETVFATRHREAWLESRLVLDAVGIPVETVQRDGWWILVVRGDDLAMAAAELDAYRHENAEQPSEPSNGVRVYQGAAAAILVYAGILLLIATLAAQWAYGLEWLSVGRMQAGRVMAGEWWRTVTALTLHLDAGHITSNLIFGAIFGFLAGRVLGGGVAWLAIVVAAALGNFINAVVQSPSHVSIGASTAVFAALGVIVAHALRPRSLGRERPLRRWSPLIGGVVLLAFTGVGGERTDVVAHLTGFLAGLLIGSVGCRLPHPWLASCNVQKSAGFATVAIVASAWTLGHVLAS